MKKIRMLLGFLFSALFCSVVFPVAVFAADSSPYGLTVAGTAVTDVNKTDILGDGKVSYDSDKGILTLKGATIAADYEVIEYKGSKAFCINLEGVNNLTSQKGCVIWNLDETGADTILQGDGTLTMSAGTNAVRVSYGNLKISGCTLNITNGEAGIYTHVGTITIDSATINGSVYKGGVISGSSGVSISNSTLNGTTTGAYNAILAQTGDITINNCENITVSGKYGDVYAASGKITVSNSTIVVNGEDKTVPFSLYSVSDMVLKDSVITAKQGIASRASLSIEGASDVSCGRLYTTGTFKVAPPADSLVEIKTGDEAGMTHVENSPFTAAVQYDSYDTGAKDFHSKLHTHEGGTATCVSGPICTDCDKEYGEVDANNHDMGDVTYTWSEDGKTCVAERVCKADGTYKETANAKVESAQTKAPTCTAKGETTYTAAFEEAWAKSETAQTKVIADVAATGHKDENKDGKCDVCGEKVGTEPSGSDQSTGSGKPSGSNASSAKKTTGAPRTGDQNGLAIWTILLIGSGAAVLCAKKKKAMR